MLKAVVNHKFDQVIVETREEYKEMMKLLASVGVKWRCGEVATDEHCMYFKTPRRGNRFNIISIHRVHRICISHGCYDDDSDAVYFKVWREYHFGFTPRKWKRYFSIDTVRGKILPHRWMNTEKDRLRHEFGNAFASEDDAGLKLKIIKGE